VESCPENYGIG